MLKGTGLIVTGTAMAGRVAKFAHDAYCAHENYRGGRYTAGFWSMSNHVAFGTLTGALPSGRQAGKPFTPGLTPHPGASKSFRGLKAVAQASLSVATAAPQ